MKVTNIREILARLHRELQRAEDVDINARETMKELHRHVDETDAPEQADVDTWWGRAKDLESRFAARHPTLERMARELADAIAKMGV